MTSKDITDVVRNEESTDDPWNEKRIADFVRKRGNVCQVAVVDDQVVGHIFYSLLKRHILCHRIVVRSGYRTDGIGREMLKKLKSKLNPKGRHELEIPVRESNVSGQVWLRGQRMVCFYVSTETSYYEDEPTFWFGYRVDE